MNEDTHADLVEKCREVGIMIGSMLKNAKSFQLSN